MTKKVTISVPDELHEKMEKWRSDFNFSKVFQGAVSNLIQNKEDFQKRLKGGKKEMVEIIERLKKEKQEYEHEWFDEGKKEGLDFAKSVSYEELQYALKRQTFEETPENRIYADPTRDEFFGEYFTDIFDTYDEMGFEKASFSNAIPNEAFCRWEAGWKEAIEEFWNEVKGKL